MFFRYNNEDILCYFLIVMNLSPCKMSWWFHFHFLLLLLPFCNMTCTVSGQIHPRRKMYIFFFKWAKYVHSQILFFKLQHIKVFYCDFIQTSMRSFQTSLRVGDFLLICFRYFSKNILNSSIICRKTNLFNVNQFFSLAVIGQLEKKSYCPRTQWMKCNFLTMCEEGRMNERRRKKKRMKGDEWGEGLVVSSHIFTFHAVE